jgi:hypothetical protein
MSLKSIVERVFMKSSIVLMRNFVWDNCKKKSFWQHGFCGEKKITTVLKIVLYKELEFPKLCSPFFATLVPPTLKKPNKSSPQLIVNLSKPSPLIKTIRFDLARRQFIATSRNVLRSSGNQSYF